MADLFIGVDPGLAGAIAFYDPAADSVEVEDMPVYQIDRGGKAKREIDFYKLAAIIDDASTSNALKAAVVERVGAMPKQGVSSTFSFGTSYGLVLGVLAAHFIPIDRVPTMQWRNGLRVPAGKDGSRSKASQLFPRQAKLFQRVKDDGRAEAVLMAVHCYRTQLTKGK